MIWGATARIVSDLLDRAGSLIADSAGVPIRRREPRPPEAAHARRGTGTPAGATRATRAARPVPGPGEVALTVRACGVCRTDLHLRDAEIEAPRLPVVLGHQIVGISDDGRRLGVPWLGWTCGECRFCRSGRENLCLRARFTGRDIDGGYAQRTVADARYCFALPDELSDEQAAPLLCGGLIGYRALTLPATPAGWGCTASARPLT